MSARNLGGIPARSRYLFYKGLLRAENTILGKKYINTRKIYPLNVSKKERDA